MSDPITIKPLTIADYELELARVQYKLTAICSDISAAAWRHDVSTKADDRVGSIYPAERATFRRLMVKLSRRPEGGNKQIPEARAAVHRAIERLEDAWLNKVVGDGEKS